MLSSTFEDTKSSPVTKEKPSSAQFTQYSQDSDDSVDKAEEEDYKEFVDTRMFDVLSQVASTNVNKRTNLPYVLSKIVSASANIHSPSVSSKSFELSDSIEVIKTVSADIVVKE